jgi:hypothetical protein
MKTNELNIKLSEIFNAKIELCELVDQSAKKWYNKQYKRDFDAEFNFGFVYGVSIYGVIDFDFSVKSIDNLMKSFYTNYINKYLAKTYDYVNGVWGQIGVQAAKDKISERLSNVRLEKYLMYSTDYGIGVWVFFMPSEMIQQTKNKLEKYLLEKQVQYKNEYSDAGWVYRYKFAGNYIDHNEIIKSIN